MLRWGRPEAAVGGVVGRGAQERAGAWGGAGGEPVW